jgi:hypothetical protein
LVGTSLLTRDGWAQPRPLSGNNNVTIRTHEHFGDIEEQLAFPSTWELDVQHMAGHGRAGLNSGQIRERLSQPIDTPPLNEIAAGKRTAVITFDDLTRPTPIADVLRLLVEELRTAGLEDENIVFLTSYGTHRPLTHAEARAKLGDWVVDNFVWLNHNIWENVVEVGVTSHGNKIKVNYHFNQADIRVTVSGIKAHGTAGYGGGGKAVLPGVAWVESIDFFHRTITGLGTNPTVGTAKVFQNEGVPERRAQGHGRGRAVGAGRLLSPNRLQRAPGTGGDLRRRHRGSPSRCLSYGQRVLTYSHGRKRGHRGCQRLSAKSASVE